MEDKTQNYFQIYQFLHLAKEEMVLNHHHLHQLLLYTNQRQQYN